MNFQQLFKLFGYPLGAINGHICLVSEIERPDIVHANNVVVVLMSHQNGVERLHACPQHLLPEVGPAIHGDSLALKTHQRRRPKALIAWVGRSAYCATAADDRHALRGSCSE